MGAAPLTSVVRWVEHPFTRQKPPVLLAQVRGGGGVRPNQKLTALAYYYRWRPEERQWLRSILSLAISTAIQTLQKRAETTTVPESPQAKVLQGGEGLSVGLFRLAYCIRCTLWMCFRIVCVGSRMLHQA